MTKAVRIAIIEDDSAIAQMYRMKFESDGYEVEVASDGMSGVEMVSKHIPDIILMDIQMPGRNGAEALKRIRKIPGAQTIPVIILTNLGQQEAPDEIIALGVSSYIVKADLTPRQVAEQVKQVLNQPAA